MDNISNGISVFINTATSEEVAGDITINDTPLPLMVPWKLGGEHSIDQVLNMVETLIPLPDAPSVNPEKNGHVKKGTGRATQQPPTTTRVGGPQRIPWEVRDLLDEDFEHSCEWCPFFIHQPLKFDSKPWSSCSKQRAEASHILAHMVADHGLIRGRNSKRPMQKYITRCLSADEETKGKFYCQICSEVENWRDGDFENSAHFGQSLCLRCYERFPSKKSLLQHLQTPDICPYRQDLPMRRKSRMLYTTFCSSSDVPRFRPPPETSLPRDGARKRFMEKSQKRSGNLQISVQSDATTKSLDKSMESYSQQDLKSVQISMPSPRQGERPDALVSHGTLLAPISAKVPSMNIQPPILRKAPIYSSTDSGFESQSSVIDYLYGQMSKPQVQMDTWKCNSQNETQDKPEPGSSRANLLIGNPVTEVYPSRLACQGPQMPQSDDDDPMPQISFNKKPTTNSTHTTTHEEDDAKTVYSIATSMMSNLAQQSILDVCQNIRNRLQLKSLDPVSDVLPESVKAFALQLGINSPNKLKLDLMYFIHKNCAEIIRQLKLMLQQENEREPEKQTESDEMSLREKLVLWGRNTGEDDFDLDAADLFQGVGDNEEDLVSETELCEYSNAVLSDKAYEWFIETLLKQCSFHLGEFQSRAMIHEVRQRILARLPKGIISKKRGPDIYNVRLQIPWRKRQTWLNEIQGSEEKQSISNCVILTCSSDDQIQASTVKEYMYQTWTFGGMELSDTVERVINSTSGERITFVQPDSTKITVSLERSLLIFDITGLGHSIAECGERLAWLVTAMYPSVGGGDTFFCRTPYLAAGSPASSKQREHITSAESGICKKDRDKCNHNTSPSHNCFEDDGSTHQNWIIQFNSENSQKMAECSQFLGAITEPVVIKGYPTRLRPEPCSGIELSNDVLLKLLGIPTLTKEDNKLLLVGSGYEFRFVRIGGTMLVWHLISSPTRVCTCGPATLPKVDFHELPDIDVNLLKFRHIVEPCIRTEGSLDSSSASNPFIRNEVEHAQTLKKHISPASSTILTDSQDMSLDPDMLSISDLSNSAQLLRDYNDTVPPIIALCAQRLLAEYKEKIRPVSRAILNMVHDSPSPGDNNGSESNASAIKTARNPQACDTQSTFKHPLKRSYNGDDANDDDGQNPRPPPSKRAKLPKNMGGSRLLACPFWKSDPLQYRHCIRYTLGKISHVKQHLSRRHTPEFYCERCFEVFTQEEVHDLHVQDSSCRRDLSKKLNGISHVQHRHLSRKSNHKLTEAEQWFGIWDIIFPSQSRPISPYIQPGISEELHCYQEFSRRRGPLILAEVFRTNGISLLPPEAMNITTQEIIFQVLEQIQDEWFLAYGHSRESRTSSSRSIQESKRDTSGDSTADSALGIPMSNTYSEHQAPVLGVDSRFDAEVDCQAEREFGPFFSENVDETRPNGITSVAPEPDVEQEVIIENDGKDISESVNAASSFTLGQIDLGSIDWDELLKGME